MSSLITRQGHSHMDNMLEAELLEKIEIKIINHKHEHFNLVTGKYYELITNMYKYKDLSSNKIWIDSQAIEYFLRWGYSVIFGQTRSGKHTIIGVAQRNLNNGASNVVTRWYENQNTIINNMTFLIPKSERHDIYTPITPINSGGNCIVLTNKFMEYCSDIKTIDHYATKMAELEGSRYSLAIQSKAVTYFTGKENSVTLNNLINKFYNAVPVMAVSDTFDVRDKIGTVDGSSIIPTLLEANKKEYENTEGELNSKLGFSTLNNSKLSGVSEVEVTQNSEYSEILGNAYLNSRQQPFDLYNERFSLEVKVIG